MTQRDRGGEAVQPDNGEFVSSPDTLAAADDIALRAIVAYGQDGEPPVSQAVIRYAAMVGDMVARAVVAGDFLLGNTPATARLAEVQRRISDYQRRRSPRRNA